MSDYKQYITEIDHLSVREFEGRELIKKLTNIEAQVLIDPTLLHDATWWSKIESNPNFDLPDRYLLSYYLGGEDGNLTREVALDNNLEIVDILNNERYSNIGPSEFLYLIHNASLVLTDSYHGSIFSLLFNTEFMLSDRKSNVDMSSRFNTLSRLLGIRFEEISPYAGLLRPNYDPVQLNRRIDYERKKSFLYLKNAFRF